MWEHVAARGCPADPQAVRRPEAKARLEGGLRLTAGGA